MLFGFTNSHYDELSDFDTVEVVKYDEEIDSILIRDTGEEVSISEFNISLPDENEVYTFSSTSNITKFRLEDGTIETFNGTEISATNVGANVGEIVEIMDWNNDDKYTSIDFTGFVKLKKITAGPIPENDIVSLSGLFSGLPIEILPRELFKNCKMLTDLSECFKDCTSLEIIPFDLFKDCKLISTVENCFEGCTLLKKLNGILFYGCESLLNLSGLFKGCTSLTDIKNYLFFGCSKVTNMSSCFENCTGIDIVSSYMFNDCVSNVDLSNCFKGCTSLQFIGEKFLTGLPTGVNFLATFMGCTSLSTIADDMFEDITAPTNLINLFNGCVGITSDVPALWDTFDAIQHTDAYEGCTNASNYADVPIGWQ